MRRKTGRRGLSGEDKRLWEAVKRTAEPLRTDEPQEPEVPEPARQPSAEPPSTSPKTPTPRLNAASRPAPPPPAGPLDRKTVSRVSRGLTPVDRRIDLHGLTQTVAHGRLLRFLEDAHANGARIVLVITGKGNDTPRDIGEPSRGVLRRAVPEWLKSAAFKPFVAGVSEAGRRHGGAGAFYVRVRRRRG